VEGQRGFPSRLMRDQRDASRVILTGFQQCSFPLVVQIRAKVADRRLDSLGHKQPLFSSSRHHRRQMAESGWD
jgi:hypothetical protein